MDKIRHLSLKWRVSRAPDTYGYNICTLTDNFTDKEYKCIGGGYDMVGTVFGHWLQDVYAARLCQQAAVIKDHYGVSLRGEQVCLNGACGIESMVKIARTLDLTIQYDITRGQTIGFFVV